MKSIIITGTARTGKSTLARIIKEKYPEYNLIEGDSIYQGIYKNIKEVNKEYEDGDTYFHSKLNKNIMISILSRFIKFENKNGKFIFVGEQIFPEELNNLKCDKDNLNIIYLSHGDSSEEEIFNNIRLNDKLHLDWTSKQDDKELKKTIREIVRRDKIFKKGCLKYGFEFVDTSKKRTETFIEIIDKIK